MKAGIINIGVDLANLSPEQQNNESWDRNYYVSAASCKTEGADLSVIYEDRHLEVMNKRPVAKRKPSVHIHQETGVPTFQPERGHDVMSHPSLDKRFQYVKRVRVTQQRLELFRTENE